MILMGSSGSWWPSWYPGWPGVDPAPPMVRLPVRPDLWLPALGIDCGGVVRAYRNDPSWLTDLIGVVLTTASTHLGRPADVTPRQVADGLYAHCARR